MTGNMIIRLSLIFICQIFLQTYADEGHELNGVLEHVYSSMEHYFAECLSLDPDDTKPDLDQNMVPAE